MPHSQPYQPLLLRILHSITALLVIGAAITGFLVYDSWDRRFGGFGFTQANRNLIDIHGTFGFLIFFVALPIFIIYCLKAGRSRLLQKNSLQQLTLVGKPIWWYTLQRLANTAMLVAALFAVISGKFQDENWLPRGEVNHIWYYIHLIAWLVVVFALAMHLLMSAKVGSLPLLLSMFDTKFRPEDSPRLWREKIINWLRRPGL
ncbi:cytochrome B [Fischerella thermalis CCMEE 5282]|uniref:cytochrome b/b6 domain-containing protein n=1 Tax=Fischerella thermalis TaxID=372787 RepID=UPI000C7F8A84|nr:cytochrome b/b6 domain-containing protein [Fischerella thermalis]PMB13657.1 cytochrome B [Fischerella thermalis CCMEE 5282]